MEEPCEYLDWDSKFFGFKIARVKASRMNEQRISAILEWCAEQKVDCLYFLADLEDPKTLLLAGRNKFQWVDIRVSLEREGAGPDPLAVVPEERKVRPCRPEDAVYLKAIARVSHQDSRFYFDDHFPRGRCDSLYESWIDQCIRDPTRQVFVLELDDKPVGYLSCRRQGSQTGMIELFGIDPRFRNRGKGEILLKHALSWFEKEGVKQVEVVTQGRNVKALRLYQKCGFMIQSMKLWCHRWFT